MIIVVANSKGGVGKSTTAVLLSEWLSRQGIPQPGTCQQAALLLRKVKNRATQRTLFD